MDQPAQVAHLLRRDPGLGRPALPGSVRKPRRPRGRSRRATSRRAWRPSRPARRDAGTPPAPISASHTTAGPCTPPRRGDRGFDVRRWRCAFHEVPGAPARAGRRCAPAPPVSAPGAIVPGRGSLRTGRIPEGAGPGGGHPGPAGAPSVRTWGEDCGGPPCSIVPPPARSPLAEKIRRRRLRSLGAMADAPAREWSSVCRAGTAPVRLGDRTVGRDLGVMTYPPVVARRRGAGKRRPGRRGAVSGRQAEAARDLEHAVARVRGPRPAAARTDPPPRSEASTPPDATLRPLTAPSRSARAVTAPVPSFVEVTARARSCFGPTLSRGRVNAYDAPPSATNSAQRTTAIRGRGQRDASPRHRALLSQTGCPSDPTAGRPPGREATTVRVGAGATSAERGVMVRLRIIAMAPSPGGRIHPASHSPPPPTSRGRRRPCARRARPAPRGALAHGLLALSLALSRAST